MRDSRDRAVARNRGTLGAAGLGGPPAGTSWDTPSTLDECTVLAEILTVSYVDSDGTDWTLAHEPRDPSSSNEVNIDGRRLW